MIQPPENLSEGAQRLAMLAHWSSLLGCFIPIVGHLLPPILFWLLSRASDAFVQEHAREALNFQIVAALTLGIGGTLLGIFGSGLGLALLFALYYGLTATGSLVAAARIRNGQSFAYLLPFRVVR